MLSYLMTFCETNWILYVYKYLLIHIKYVFTLIEWYMNLYLYSCIPMRFNMVIHMIKDTCFLKLSWINGVLELIYCTYWALYFLLWDWSQAIVGPHVLVIMSPNPGINNLLLGRRRAASKPCAFIYCFVNFEW